MNDVLFRIRKVFNDSGKSQTEIGKKIGKTSQYVWKLLNDDTANPSNSVIGDICREFNVNKEWILNGEGEPYKSSKGAFSELLSDLEDSDDDFIKDLLTVYMDLDDDSKKALRKLAKGLAEKRNGQN